MSRKTKKNDAEELPEEVAPEAQEETTPESELEQVIREREEFKLNWQRAQADYQNLKRRTAAEIDGAMRRSSESAVKLLPLMAVLLCRVAAMVAVAASFGVCRSEFEEEAA